MRIETKAYQSEIRNQEVGFSNYKRIDELSLFNEVLLRLRKLENVVIGKKKTGPSEDYYECTIDGESFVLIYDINYGVSAYSDEKTTRQRLIECFNDISRRE